MKEGPEGDTAIRMQPTDLLPPASSHFPLLTASNNVIIL